ALRNNLALYEIHVGRYYMKKNAYVAAVNRMHYVIQNFQRTPAIPLALKIMEAAYKEMSMNDLAADAARVYALNYANGIPNSEYTELNQSLADDIWDFIGLDED
ncbi:MAG: outer membrane protein assembly factor BamD, partial [Methylococcales bacterium]